MASALVLSTKDFIMKMNGTLEGGIVGATTLGLISETLQRINGNSSHVNLFRKGKLQKRLKKTKSKGGLRATKQYLRLAEDILGSSAYLGLSTLGKKKHTMLRGGLLGTAAGLGNVFLKEKEESHKTNGDHLPGQDPEDKLSTKILKVSLYTIGGLIAGRLVETLDKKNQRKKK